LEIDKETGTTFWADAIAKEMKTFFVAFEILPQDAKAPPGHTFLKCHMIFDLKSDGSTQRKARFVAGDHMTGEPEYLTYASVVSRESIRLAFMLASLNGLEVLQADVEGAYLNAKSTEKLSLCAVLSLENLPAGAPSFAVHFMEPSPQRLRGDQPFPKSLKASASKCAKPTMMFGWGKGSTRLVKRCGNMF
jgi:hypothetical protein